MTDEHGDRVIDDDSPKAEVARAHERITDLLEDFVTEKRCRAEAFTDAMAAVHAEREARRKGDDTLDRTVQRQKRDIEELVLADGGRQGTVYDHDRRILALEEKAAGCDPEGRLDKAAAINQLSKETAWLRKAVDKIQAGLAGCVPPIITTKGGDPGDENDWKEMGGSGARMFVPMETTAARLARVEEAVERLTKGLDELEKRFVTVFDRRAGHPDVQPERPKNPTPRPEFLKEPDWRPGYYTASESKVPAPDGADLTQRHGQTAPPITDVEQAEVPE